MSTDKKYNILIIPSWYPSEMDPNGVPFVRSQAQALARAGNSVTVIFTQAYSLKTVLKQKRLMWGDRYETLSGVNEIHSYFPKTHIKRIDEETRYIQGKRLIKKWIRANGKPDIIHVHTFLAGKLGIWFHNNYKVPLITTEHYTGFARGIVKPWEMKRARRLYQFSSENLAVSSSFAQLLKKKTGAPFTTLPNMVNTTLFDRGDSIRNFDKKFTYLFVGFLHEKKNPMMLLKAFYSLYCDDSSVNLIIVGEGPMEKEMKSYVFRKGIGDSVSFKGFLQSEKVARIMKMADAFVLPSRFETFGIVAIEAMASGMPVIATRSGGPESFIQDGFNGFTVDQNVEQLSLAMKKAKNVQWDHSRIRQFVLDRFSEVAVIAELVKKYKTISTTPEIIQASRELSLSGGISKVAYQLALQLTKNDFRVTTFTTDWDNEKEEKQIGRVIRLSMPGWIGKLPVYLKNYLKTLFFTRKVNSIYRYKNENSNCVTISHRDSYGADIAIGHSCHKESVKIKKSDGKSLWFLNPIHKYYIKQEKAICKKPDMTLAAISSSIAGEYIENYQLDSSRIKTIPNGVDLNRFSLKDKGKIRKEILSEISLPEEAFLLLFVGNEFDRKGLGYVIDALKTLDKALVHLIILGGADSTPYIKKAEKLNIQNNIHFMGRRADAPRFFIAADLFVIPANYEPFGLVGIESMSSGTPVLACPVGGFLDYLEDGKNGFFIKRDPESIAQKIRQIMSDSKCIATMSRNARATAESYSWDKIGAEYSQLVQEVVDKKQ